MVISEESLDEKVLKSKNLDLLIPYSQGLLTSTIISVIEENGGVYNLIATNKLELISLIEIIAPNYYTLALKSITKHQWQDLSDPDDHHLNIFTIIKYHEELDMTMISKYYDFTYQEYVDLSPLLNWYTIIINRELTNEILWHIVKNLKKEVQMCLLYNKKNLSDEIIEHCIINFNPDYLCKFIYTNYFTAEVLRKYIDIFKEDDIVLQTVIFIMNDVCGSYSTQFKKYSDIIKSTVDIIDWQMIILKHHRRGYLATTNRFSL